MRSWNESWLCGPGSSFHGPWGMIVNLVFWLLIILMVVWFFRLIFRIKNQQQNPSPLAVLKHRYAAGEIDREEFERMKKELSE